MILPELRVLVERAAAHRAALESLLDVIPADYLPNRGPGDGWSVRNHLEHLATVEDFVVETLETVEGGAAEAWAANEPTLARLLERRSQRMAAVENFAVGDLRARMASSRQSLVLRLSALDPARLETPVMVAGLVDAWGQPRRFSLREYLRSWPDHDVEHAFAIRAAISTRPDLSVAAMARRRRP